MSMKKNWDLDKFCKKKIKQLKLIIKYNTKSLLMLIKKIPTWIWGLIISILWGFGYILNYIPKYMLFEKFGIPYRFIEINLYEIILPVLLVIIMPIFIVIFIQLFIKKNIECRNIIIMVLYFGIIFINVELYYGRLFPITGTYYEIEFDSISSSWLSEEERTEKVKMNTIIVDDKYLYVGEYKDNMLVMNIEEITKDNKIIIKKGEFSVKNLTNRVFNYNNYYELELEE